MTVDSDKATRCLEKACNGEWRYWCMWHVKNLHKKYANTETLLASKLRQELHILKMKEEGNPTYLSKNIATIQM